MDSTDPTIDPKLLRQALGVFVTGVTVVTTRDSDGRPVGLTANSFNSVSLDPPLVLWSLALQSPNLEAFRSADHWTVHILTAEQRDLSQRFATKGVDKFSDLEFDEGPSRVPLLRGCAARFVCRSTFEYEGGDHAIFVGEVVGLEFAPAQPLVFHGGRYGQVMPRGAPIMPPEGQAIGEFGRYFTGHTIGRAHSAVFADIRREYRKRGLRAAEYSVLVGLGLGEGVDFEVLRTRAANGGVSLPQAAVGQVLEKGLVKRDGELLYFTASGRQCLSELVAVAQATQLKVDAVFTVEEVALLHELLNKLSEDESLR